MVGPGLAPPLLIHESREAILHGMLRASVILGAVAYVPGAWASFQAGLPQVVLLSSTVYGTLLLAAFLPGLTFRGRAVAFLGVNYALAVGLLFMVGPPGAGAVWLVAVPVIAGVLQGTRTALWSLGVVALTTVGFGVLIHLGLAGPLAGAVYDGYTLDAWGATSGSLLFLAAVLSLGVGVLLDRLEDLASREREGRLRLEETLAQQLLLESQLRQAQKLESLGTLAGGIAHDLNNLLVPIVAGVDEALEELPPDSQVRRHLEEALQSAERGRELVSRILGFSRGSSGERARTPLAESLEEVTQLLRRIFPATVRIRLEIEAPEAVVQADAVELQQVFMNLATNGYLALEDRTGEISFHLRTVNGEGVVEVRDNGVGMTQDTLARALDPFFTTRGPEEGTGLGLSTVHGIVRSLGGALEIRSAPGEGTSVEVRLPLALSGASATPGESRASDARSRPQVGSRGREAEGDGPPVSTHLLLVDDDPAVLRVTARILDRRGYQVTMAEGANDALELLVGKSVPFDLLLTDHTMPERTGLELIRLCREAGLDLPALLMSGYLTDDLKGEAARIGATLLAKPFDRGELIRSVEEALAADPDPEPES